MAHRTIPKAILQSRDALRRARPGSPEATAARQRLQAAEAERRRPQVRAAVARYRAGHRADIARAREVYNALMARRAREAKARPPDMRRVATGLREFLRADELAILLAALRDKQTRRQVAAKGGQT